MSFSQKSCIQNFCITENALFLSYFPKEHTTTHNEDKSVPL